MFCALIFLLVVRYAIYLSLELTEFTFFDIKNPRTYIPFYLSELIICLVYIYFLIRVYKNKEIEVKQQEKLQQEQSQLLQEYDREALGLIQEQSVMSVKSSQAQIVNNINQTMRASEMG